LPADRAFSPASGVECRAPDFPRNRQGRTRQKIAGGRVRESARTRLPAQIRIRRSAVIHASVAVLRNEAGELSGFSTAVAVEIYRKQRQGRNWKSVRAIPFSAGTKPPAMRKAAKALAAELEDTRILLGTSVSGIAYTTLDQLGFRLCELEVFSPECLDALVEAVETQPVTIPAPDRPQESDSSGVYRLDLALALEARPDLSSKRILRPFLRGTTFSRLDLACGHVPPWLLPELESRGLGCSRSSLPGGGILLRIFSLEPAGGEEHADPER
jgi:hypothetical protein